MMIFYMFRYRQVVGSASSGIVFVLEMADYHYKLLTMLIVICHGLPEVTVKRNLFTVVYEAVLVLPFFFFVFVFSNINQIIKLFMF